MPKYLIEREIPQAGNLTPQQLQAISQKSCGVLRNLGPQIQWLQSYVTDNKIYCVYIAPTSKWYETTPARLPRQQNFRGQNGNRSHYRRRLGLVRSGSAPMFCR